MSFDYLAYNLPTSLLAALKAQPTAFLNVFYESNYTENFDELLEEYEKDVITLGKPLAESIYTYVQSMVDSDDGDVLELEGEYWAAPVSFFLTAEFDEEDLLPQPNFLTKKYKDYLLVNALAGTKTIETADELIMVYEPEDIAVLIDSLKQIIHSDFKKRWTDLIDYTGQYADAFEEEDLAEFCADMHEFFEMALLPFYEKVADQKHAVLIVLN